VNIGATVSRGGSSQGEPGEELENLEALGKTLSALEFEEGQKCKDWSQQEVSRGIRVLERKEAMTYGKPRVTGAANFKFLGGIAAIKAKGGASWY